MERYDIIIIGSGINSLTAGALLSKKGKKVFRNLTYYQIEKSKLNFIKLIFSALI